MTSSYSLTCPSHATRRIAGLCGCDCGDSCELREISEGSCDFFNHGVQGEVVLNLTSCQRTASFANRTELSGIQFCAKSAKKSWRDLNFKLYQSCTIDEILLENHWGLEFRNTFSASTYWFLEL